MYLVGMALMMFAAGWCLAGVIFRLPTEQIPYPLSIAGIGFLLAMIGTLTQ